MAASKNASCYEDLVFCAVCMEVYEDPQSLVCRHSLCMKCVIKLTKQNQVKCPTCRKQCDRNDIAKDYNTAKYVEFYHINELDDMANKRKCQVCCSSVACPDVQFCFSCSQLLLLGLSKEPTARSAQDYVKIMKAALQLSKRKLQQKKVVFTTWLEYVHAEMVKLKQVEDAILKWSESLDIKLQRTEEIMNSEDSILIENAHIVTEDVESVLENIDVQVTGQNKLLKDVGLSDPGKFHGDYINIHPDIANYDTENSTQRINERAISSESLTHQASNVTPRQTTPERAQRFNDTQMYIHIPALNHLTPVPGYIPEYRTIQHSMNYTAMTKYNLANLGVENSESNRLHSICIANDRLLVVSDRMLYVFTRDCHLQNRITYDNFHDCRQVVKRGAGPQSHIVVSGVSGLNVLNMKGRLKYKVAPETVHYLTPYKYFIYAMKSAGACGTRNIDVYEKFKEWQRVNTYKVKYKNPSEYDTLGVGENKLYIGSYDNHCVYCFELDGTLTHRFGKHEEDIRGSIAGRFWNPRLVHVDNDGGLLIADVSNQRLQRRSSSGQWTIVSKDIGTPWDVLIDQNNENIMWVLTRNGELLKLRKT